MKTLRPASPLRVLPALIASLGLMGCPNTTDKLNLPPLQSVAQVDLARYLGTWYEIASFPQSFQKGCQATSATYALKENGDISVVNSCHIDALDGPLKVANGRARVVDTSTNARLKVSFFGPFWGAYWIIDLGDDYEYAVVGHPGRDYLWILSRSPHMDEQVYNGILERLVAKDYQIDRLNRTPQP